MLVHLLLRVHVIDNNSVRVLFKQSPCLCSVFQGTIQVNPPFPLIKTETRGSNKGLNCKQSSLGFKHVITTVSPFVIVQHRGVVWNTSQCKSNIMDLNGTQVQTQTSYITRQMDTAQGTGALYGL